MNVVITESAWADMLAIGTTIREDSPHRAETFIEELFECCLGIGRMPRAYPLLPSRESSGVRRRLYGNYLIFYRIAENQIEVVHILHGARDYERILFPED
jgi:toxin ParE1/3/4